MDNVEKDYLMERLQNRKIRIELTRLNTINNHLLRNIKSYNYEKIFQDKRFSFGKSTPPSNTDSLTNTYYNSDSNLEQFADSAPDSAPDFPPDSEPYSAPLYLSDSAPLHLSDSLPHYLLDSLPENTIDYFPEQCPICFNVIWRDTNIIECFFCKKILCHDCYDKMKESCIHHEKQLKCPMCRAILLDYYNEQTPLNPLYIDNDIEANQQLAVVQNIREQNRGQQNRDADDPGNDNYILYLSFGILMIIIMVIVVII